MADMLHVMASSRTRWGRARRVKLLLSKIQFGSHPNSLSLFFFFFLAVTLYTLTSTLIFSFSVSLTSDILPSPPPRLSFHVMGTLTLSSLANGDGLYTFVPLGQLAFCLCVGRSCDLPCIPFWAYTPLPVVLNICAMAQSYRLENTPHTCR